MLKLISYFLLVSACLFLFSQEMLAQDFEWFEVSGGTRSDKGTQIIADNDGNTYITGYYNEQGFFGPFDTGFSFQSSKEVYVAKMDPNGNYLWVSNGLNYYDDRGLGLCLDPQGNVYVTGTCWGGLDWGSLSVYNSTSYTDQIFVVKLDNNGNEIWMKNAGNDDGTVSFGTNENGDPQTLYQDDHGQDLACDSNGNIYVTGFLSNISSQQQVATFDGITVQLAPEDSTGFVAKLSNDGNWIWVETFGGEFEQRDIAITVDDDDNVYLTGAFSGTQSFGPHVMTANGESDIYVTKVDSDGNFLWARQAGGSLKDVGIDVCYGHSGFIYITGEFRDLGTFGTTILDNFGGPSGRDIFVAKMSKSGDWIWANQAGSTKGRDRGNGIVANKQGNIFVTGQFSSETYFGSNTVDSNGDSVTVFIAGIDTLGAWRWVQTGGGPEYDRGADITCDTSCNVWVHGYIDNAATFGPFSESPVWDKDAFTVKLNNACFDYSTPPEEPETEQCTLLSTNIITANGDNLNDVYFFAEQCNVEIEAVVVNRWGNIVFETTDPSIGWDGTNQRGTPVSEGVYFYRVKTNFSEMTNEEISGFIHVVR